MEVDKKPEESELKEKKEEPLSYTLQNPFRVVPAQEPYLSYIPKERFQPLNPQYISGFVMLRDTNPTENVEYVDNSQTKPNKIGALTQWNTPPVVILLIIILLLVCNNNYIKKIGPRVFTFYCANLTSK